MFNFRKKKIIEQKKLVAEQKNAAKSEFLANMSHEIRTPINSIIGLNEMILRECEDPIIRGYSQDIASAGHALLSLINDILDFSKIEAGKMEINLESYELASLLNDITNMISSRAKSKNLEFIVDVDTKLPSRLKGDPIRIQQIILNLLSNAVKYTNEGFIRFSVKQTDWNKDKMNLFIEVQDSGIGIKEEDLSALFTSFTRFDLNKNRNIEGTGLGLAIAKKLTEAMGGKISVKSKYSEGSTFTVEIPQEIIDFNHLGNYKEHFEKFKFYQQKRKESFTAPNAKILIVDDNDMNLHVAKSLIKQTLIDVTLCSSGKECLEIVKKEHFDIIFLDLMMPEMDGTETLQKLKTIEKNLCAETPIIALTANASLGIKEKYLNEGFTDYIAKPIEVEIFEKTIRKYLPQNKVIPVSDELLLSKSNKFSEFAEAAVIRTKDSHIDQKAGLVYCANDSEIYNEILKIYINDFNKNAKNLQNYFDSADWKNYAIIAHSIKSTSLTIGASELSNKAKSLEFSAKEEKIEFIKNIHNSFLQVYKEVVENAEKILQKSSAENWFLYEKNVIMANLQKILNKLNSKF